MKVSKLIDIALLRREIENTEKSIADCKRYEDCEQCNYHFACADELSSMRARLERLLSEI